MEKRAIWKIGLAVIILIVLVSAIYLTFFYSKKCNDLSCYFSYQADCSKASMINDQSSIVLQYNIRGMEDGKCQVDVKVLQVKEGSVDKQVLEGKVMSCYLNKGEVSLPESDLTQCHGLLKEQIQEIMIKNAHAQIISNLGEIAPELSKVL